MTITEKIRKNPPTLANRIYKIIDGKVSTYQLADQLNMDHLKLLKILFELRDNGRIEKIKEVFIHRSFYVVYHKTKNERK